MKFKNVFILFFVIFISNFNATYSMKPSLSFSHPKEFADANEGWLLKILKRENLVEFISRKINDGQTNQNLIEVALQDVLSKIKREKSDLSQQIRRSGKVQRFGTSVTKLINEDNPNIRTKLNILYRYETLEKIIMDRLGKITT